MKRHSLFLATLNSQKWQPFHKMILLFFWGKNHQHPLVCVHTDIINCNLVHLWPEHG